MSLKAVRDYICPSCNYVLLDQYGDYEDIHLCVRCTTQMEFLPTRINADMNFAGSHVSEYGSSKRQIQGTTSAKILESLEKDQKEYKAARKKVFESED